MTSHQLYIVSGVLIFGLPVIISAVPFCFARKADTVELYETRLRMLAVIVLCTTIVAVNAVVGLQLLKAGSTRHSLEWLAGLVCLIPALLPPIDYMLLEWRYTRRYGRWLSSESVANATILPYVQQLSEVLGLAAAPKVKVSPIRGISPLCFGKSNKRVTLVLPADFVEIIEAASGGHPRTSDYLRRLVLGHELAHIRNGDCAMAACINLLLWDLRRITVVYTLGFAVYFILRTPGDMILTVLLTLYFTHLGVVMLPVMAASAFRHRELLADARISLYLPDDAVRLLTRHAVDDGLSPLEWLMQRFRFSGFRSPHSRNRGIGRFIFESQRSLTRHGTPRPAVLPRWVRSQLELALDRHPGIEDRIQYLSAKTFSTEALPCPSQAAALHIHLTSAFASLTFVAVGLTVALGSGVGVGPISKHVSAFPLALLQLVSFVYPGVALALPSIGAVAHHPLTVRSLSVLFKRHMVGLVPVTALFLFFEVTVCPWLWFLCPAALPAVVVLLACTGLCQFLSILPAILLALASSVPRSANTYGVEGARNLFLLWGPSFLVAFGPLAVMLLRLSPAAVLIGTVLAASWFVPLVALMLEGSEASPWLIVIRFPWRRVILEEGQFWSRAVPLLGAVVALLFTLPAVLIALLAHAGWGVATRTGHEVGLCAAVMFFAVGVFYVLFHFIDFTQGPLHRFLDLRHYLTLLQAFNREPPQSSLLRIAEFLRKQQTPAGGFPCRRGSPFAFLSPTFHAAMCLRKVNGDTEVIRAAAQWILSCRDADGGFGLWPGGRPCLAPTCWAVVALDALDSQMTEPNRKATAQWVAFSEQHRTRRTVEETFHAVQALRILGSLDLLNHDPVIREMRDALGKGNSDIETVYFAVETLHILEQLDEPTRLLVQERFVRPWAPTVNRLPVHPNLRLLSAYASLANRVSDGKGSDFRELLPGMEDRVAVSFEKSVEADL